MQQPIALNANDAVDQIASYARMWRGWRNRSASSKIFGEHLRNGDNLIGNWQAVSSPKAEHMREYRFPVVIEYDPAEQVYLADCPLLPGCYTDGQTYEEAMDNIRDAIRPVVESRLAVGDPVPVQDFVTVAV